MSGDKVGPGSLGHIFGNHGFDFHQSVKQHRTELKAQRGAYKASQVREDVEELKEPKRDSRSIPELLGYPPGVAGIAARWLEAGNTVNNPQASIASVLGFSSGICGRSVYNDAAKEDGINLYLCLMAPSAAGKEWMWGGCSRLIRQADLEQEERDIFGPRPASGQVLAELLLKAPSTIVPLGEMGKWLQRVIGRNANGAEIALQGELLTLYNKSAPGATWRGQATKGNVPQMIRSPSLTIIGESTPSTLWASLSDESSANGFLSRFVLIEAAAGEDRYKTRMDSIPADVQDSLDQMRGLWTTDSPERFPVRWSSEATATDHEHFQAWSETKMSAEDLVREIISRMRQNAPRIAANLALWDAPRAPVVRPEHVEWAWLAVNLSCQRLIEAFRAGDVDSSHQGDNVDRVMDYCIQRAGVGGMIERRRIQSGVKRKLRFTGPTFSPALRDALNECIASGLLAPVPESKRPDGTLGEVYLVVRAPSD